MLRLKQHLVLLTWIFSIINDIDYDFLSPYDDMHIIIFMKYITGLTSFCIISDQVRPLIPAYFGSMVELETLMILLKMLLLLIALQMPATPPGARPWPLRKSGPVKTPTVCSISTPPLSTSAILFATASELLALSSTSTSSVQITNPRERLDTGIHWCYDSFVIHCPSCQGPP